MRAVAIFFRPINRLFLRFESGKLMVRVIFDNVIV